MSREVESKSFIVRTPDGIRSYKKTDEVEYLWNLIGDTLLISKKLYHKTFTNAVVSEDRVKAYAKGEWCTVTVIEDDET